MRRVLIITYYWPPAGGSGVQRWLKFSKYLPSTGWQPVIYTPANPERSMTDASLSKDIPPEAEIITRKITEPYSLFKKFTGGNKGKAGGQRPEAINPIKSMKGKSLKMRIALWIRANLFIPDPRCLWIDPSVKYLRKYLAEHPVEAIVSTGPPHSMHLIARKLHEKTGIRWIADFRDPWTGIYYFKHLPLISLSRRRHIGLEKKVLTQANEVVAVTPLMQDDFRAMTAGICNPDKFHLIENGYDGEDFKGGAETDRMFTIVHTGMFFAESNPHKLWKVLKRVCDADPVFKEKMRIELAGRCDEEVISSIEEAGLKENLTLKGYLPHNETNRRQREGRVLLISTPNGPEGMGILTGKLFEYLAAGRPIAAFGLHDSVLEKVLRRTGAGELFDWDEEKRLEVYLLVLYRKYLEETGLDDGKCLEMLKLLSPIEEERPQYPHPDKEEIRRYSRKELAKRYSELLNGR